MLLILMTLLFRRPHFLLHTTNLPPSDHQRLVELNLRLLDLAQPDRKIQFSFMVSLIFLNLAFYTPFYQIGDSYLSQTESRTIF